MPTGTRRTSLGAGLVDIAGTTVVDPQAAVLENPVIAEEKRYCGSCGARVGRARAGKPARPSGFCPRCRQPFDFVPKLRRGEILAGQYEVAGCLAHGGLGWIYLARDRAVNDRWVVLKGLLNAGDEASMAVAVAEKRFLAEIEHGDILKIYNFVTHGGAGYIVMEYIGGRSLKQILQDRRELNGGQPDPLPVEQAMAFLLAVFPAFAYLHGRGLVYCDFKPDNLIQVGDHVKLIDLGAVRRIDDPSGDVYGTVGFQAPEIAEMGPSVSSDLYTLGRTLAVLTLDFRGYQSDLRHSLPDPADHAALTRYESFHRFLLKATAPHPDDRFQSAPEMGDQLLGVLREVVALDTGVPQPAPPIVFGPILDDEAIPALAIDSTDAAATFLTNLPAGSAGETLGEIEAATAAGQVPLTVEVRLRRTRALIDDGQHSAAEAEVDAIEQDDPWDWRAHWLRGVSALAIGDAARATVAFDRCWSEVPGELAPKLAAALAFERAGNSAKAAALYEIVASVDPSYVAAARGLARCRAQAGDLTGALAACQLIPRSHRAFSAAQLDGVAMLTAARRYPEAAARLADLDIDHLRRAQLDVELFEAALTARVHGQLAETATTAAGFPLDERGLRLGLEEALRRLAHLVPERAERIHLIDRANSARPLTVL